MTTEHDPWTDRLSEFLDGDLDAAEHAAGAAHVASCVECRMLLAALTKVAGDMRQLADRPPAIDLWPAIAAQIEAPRVVGTIGTGATRRRITFTVPQLLAASIAVALAGGAVVRMATRDARNTPAAVATSAPRPVTTPTVTRVAATRPMPTYDETIAELRAAMAQPGRRLDSTTVRVLEKNLTIIDAALADAERALAADPGNSYLTMHRARARARKITLLRQAALLGAST
jgi:hypothetical protein